MWWYSSDCQWLSDKQQLGAYDLFCEVIFNKGITLFNMSLIDKIYIHKDFCCKIGVCLKVKVFTVDLCTLSLFFSPFWVQFYSLCPSLPSFSLWFLGSCAVMWYINMCWMYILSSAARRRKKKATSGRLDLDKPSPATPWVCAPALLQVILLNSQCLLCSHSAFRCVWWCSVNATRIGITGVYWDNVYHTFF